MTKKICTLFDLKTPIPDTPPLWLMRQAGRYLPEYQAVRNQAGDFLSLCYNPVLAEEVTLQPLRRFSFDAAILFADILLIPQSLGQKLWFETGEGPRLEPVKHIDDLSLANMDKTLSPVYETIRRLCTSLQQNFPHIGLIGFAGAPWTVISYMIAGRGTPTQMPARHFAQENPDLFQDIIDIVVEATSDYLSQQIIAGVEIIQIFESWAENLHGDMFERYCLVPVKRIIENLRKNHKHIPIIAFPRNSSYNLRDYACETGANGIGLGDKVDLEEIARIMPDDIILQGNLSPEILLQGGENMKHAVRFIKETLHNKRYIFNLAHGIIKETPPQHVADLVDYVRHI